ncbi:putative wax ester synthase/diacylglycerol acyltransferase [Gordonia hirsuta DSM 44140 = NBRC 16056]|uniref:Diacylglycerol O-acyltransferase n=1 Tax=Gordonia hirsuta DSM 44140 = NBRC 16056 TaxID=1121927 RepID=L7LDZ4_9ACTN|nr:wax ester/triacylglycerol synthase family O-acyltransferase [Gordonia hirsuta]GAC58273.1 putative wax ester synthase/diacylglycerol acyltransferase [Gordonia hirsuta DSM 44140 = NBRC 16056]
MKLIPPTESMFLIAETRDQPMHVGGLQLFVPREGQTAAELADELHEALVSATDIDETFLKRPAAPARVAGYLAWQQADDLDLDYHVRRIALPRPGAILDLLRYVSLNHGTLLDRSKPMWEVHIIEGLADGRLGVFSKIHHSVVDGVTALRVLQRFLTTDPDDRSGTAFWDKKLRRKRKPRPPAPQKSLLGRVTDTAGTVVRTADDVIGMAPAAAKVALSGVRDDNYAPPMVPAPKTMLNVPIGSARRFAAQDWPTERIRAAAARHGITVNDVILTMCSGALRSYLDEHDSLPDDSLVAMVPVSLHDEHSHGNSVTAILAKLATDVPDPAERVREIHASTNSAKDVVRSLPPLQQLALGAANIWPLALSLVPGTAGYTPQGFNLVISTVPAQDEPLYWNGARLDGCYPASIPVEGQALNITITSIGGKTCFGLAGARAQVPSLQRMLDHLETALIELEEMEPLTGA